jgi:tRNA synthetases class I (C) catalytic domain
VQVWSYREHPDALLTVLSAHGVGVTPSSEPRLDGSPYHSSVSLHLYDTASRSMREFHPARNGTASIYVCGATVQSIPHIGHIRGALNFDVVRRWLTHHGNDVLLVRNVTDIEDKVLAKSKAASVPSRPPTTRWAACRRRSRRAPPRTSRR